jgi:hypothetical protein
MCKRTDEKVKVLNTDTPVHPQCMENAALGRLIKSIGFKEEKPVVVG